MFDNFNHFSAFYNLEELDLSGNQITDIMILQLQRLPSLCALDLHSNLINNSLTEVQIPTNRFILEF
jgi:Leucine-rich repeat (LRR) protein